MISKNTYQYLDYLESVEDIENYEEAISDTNKTWHCHHKLETEFSDETPRPVNARLSKDELIALNVYFSRPASELIFLKQSDHIQLHNKDKFKGKKHFTNGAINIWSTDCPDGFYQGTNRKGIPTNKVPWNKGIKYSEEMKQRLSEVHKGKRLSEETKRKLSEIRKGHPGYMKGKFHSDETRKKMSEAQKARWAKIKGEEQV